jgi:uncharacterized membrane protein YhaH (DUF805 family)
MALGAVAVLLVQFGFGSAVNLFVTIPSRHPGAHPSNYLAGSWSGVIWAMSHGAFSLVVHAILGLVLVLMAISIVVRATRMKDVRMNTWAILGLLFIVGAGFNGASFLDYNKNVSSFVMALLGFASIASYAIMLYSLSSTQSSSD